MADFQLTTDEFRQDFPAFANAGVFPDEAILFWFKVAGCQLRQSRWGNLFRVGIELYAAHNLILEKQAQDASNAGGTPGLTTGPVSSKSIGPVSINYDTGAGTEDKAGQWNLTTYGMRLARLINMVGMGPIQLGYGGPIPENSGPAWAGPWTSQFPNPSD